MTTLDDFIGQTALGQASTTAALVMALDKAGVVSRADYCRELRQLWAEMPIDAAAGPAGGVIEDMLDLLEPGPRPLKDHPRSKIATLERYRQAG